MLTLPIKDLPVSRRFLLLPTLAAFLLVARVCEPGHAQEVNRSVAHDAGTVNSGATTAARPVAAPFPQVAKVSLAGARIRRLPSARAVVICKVALGTELAVTKQQGMWLAVLMSDRSTGWVPSRYVTLTGVPVSLTARDNITTKKASGKKAKAAETEPAISK